MTKDQIYKIELGSNIRFSPDVKSDLYEFFLGKEKITVPRFALSNMRTISLIKNVDSQISDLVKNGTKLV